MLYPSRQANGRPAVTPQIYERLRTAIHHEIPIAPALFQQNIVIYTKLRPAKSYVRNANVSLVSIAPGQCINYEMAYCGEHGKAALELRPARCYRPGSVALETVSKLR